MVVPRKLLASEQVYLIVGDFCGERAIGPITIGDCTLYDPNCNPVCRRPNGFVSTARADFETPTRVLRRLGKLLSGSDGRQLIGLGNFSNTLKPPLG